VGQGPRPSPPGARPVPLECVRGDERPASQSPRPPPRGLPDVRRAVGAPPRPAACARPVTRDARRSRALAPPSTVGGHLVSGVLPCRPGCRTSPLRAARALLSFDEVAQPRRWRHELELADDVAPPPQSPPLAAHRLCLRRRRCATLPPRCSPRRTPPAARAWARKLASGHQPTVLRLAPGPQRAEARARTREIRGAPRNSRQAQGSTSPRSPCSYDRTT
jgi:hypothetical protein